MSADPGLFIAIEAASAEMSGRYVALLEQRLTDLGHTVLTFHFPRHASEASYFAHKYSRGEYGDHTSVSPYTAALLYGLDRFDAAATIRSAKTDGAIVLCGNYVGSTMAEQGSKFGYAEERRGFYIWLDNLEYQMLGVPRPDISLALADPDGSRAALALQELAHLFPKDFQQVAVRRDEQQLDEDAVLKLLWGKIEPQLPQPIASAKPAQKSEPKGHKEADTTIAGLLNMSPLRINADVLVRNQQNQLVFMAPPMRQDLLAAFETTVRRQHALYDDLSQALRAVGADPAAAMGVLPLSTQMQIPGMSVGASELVPINDLGEELSLDALPYAAVLDKPKLLHRFPRNETDLLPFSLFQRTETGFSNLQDTTAVWPINRKLDALEKLLSIDSEMVLKYGLYYWEVVANYDTVQLLNRCGIRSIAQVPTPRFGYEVPATVESAGLTERYEAAFAASLELHDQLVGAGATTAAQSAVLLGHTGHWLLVHSGLAVSELRRQRADASASGNTLIGHMLEALEQAHPSLFA